MAFGFTTYPNQPSQASQDVGAALLQRRMATPYGPGDQPQAPAVTPASLRLAGAKRMGGTDQIDHGALPDGTNPNAISIAVGEAMTRMGGGNQPNPNPFKPRAANLQQLQALGLSPIEAQLLGQTGGA
jgi:hypothetical protein